MPAASAALVTGSPGVARHAAALPAQDWDILLVPTASGELGWTHGDT